MLTGNRIRIVLVAAVAIMLMLFIGVWLFGEVDFSRWDVGGGVDSFTVHATYGHLVETSMPVAVVAHGAPGLSGLADLTGSAVAGAIPRRSGAYQAEFIAVGSEEGTQEPIARQAATLLALNLTRVDFSGLPFARRFQADMIALAIPLAPSFSHWTDWDRVEEKEYGQSYCLELEGSITGLSNRRAWEARIAQGVASKEYLLNIWGPGTLQLGTDDDCTLSISVGPSQRPGPLTTSYQAIFAADPGSVSPELQALIPQDVATGQFVVLETSIYLREVALFASNLPAHDLLQSLPGAQSQWGTLSSDPDERAVRSWYVGRDHLDGREVLTITSDYSDVEDGKRSPTSYVLQRLYLKQPLLLWAQASRGEITANTALTRLAASEPGCADGQPSDPATALVLANLWLLRAKESLTLQPGVAKEAVAQVQSLAPVAAADGLFADAALDLYWELCKLDEQYAALVTDEISRLVETTRHVEYQAFKQGVIPLLLAGQAVTQEQIKRARCTTAVIQSPKLRIMAAEAIVRSMSLAGQPIDPSVVQGLKYWKLCNLVEHKNKADESGSELSPDEMISSSPPQLAAWERHYLNWLFPDLASR